MRINIVIDSVALDGYANYDSEGIIAALEKNLSQLVNDNGNGFSQSAMEKISGRSEVVYDAPIEIYSNADHNTIGAQIAQSIYDTLT